MQLNCKKNFFQKWKDFAIWGLECFSFFRKAEIYDTTPLQEGIQSYNEHENHVPDFCRDSSANLFPAVNHIVSW